MLGVLPLCGDLILGEGVDGEGGGGNRGCLKLEGGDGVEEGECEKRKDPKFVHSLSLICIID